MQIDPVLSIVYHHVWWLSRHLCTREFRAFPDLRQVHSLDTARLFPTVPASWLGLIFLRPQILPSYALLSRLTPDSSYQALPYQTALGGIDDLGWAILSIYTWGLATILDTDSRSEFGGRCVGKLIAFLLLSWYEGRSTRWILSTQQPTYHSVHSST
jgi:hypothetical protein